MSFLDSFKSRKKNDEEAAEQEFQRGLREGSWPQGVDDFQLMSNTGTFLPAIPDPDPRAEADAFVKEHADDAHVDWSVVRAAGSTRTEGGNGFRVIEGTAGVRPLKGGPASAPAAATSKRAAEDDGVQVMPRAEGRAPRATSAGAGAPKSYAERLRDRVAAADVAAKPANKPAAAVSQSVSQAKRPTQNRPAAAPVSMQGASRPAAVPATASPRTDAPKPAAPAAASSRANEAPTFSSDAVVIRTRTYDDVRRIAEGLLAEKRPVVLAMRGSSDATCQRILDFSFGMCCASGAAITELSQKLFAICPKGVSVSDATMGELKRQGLLR